MNPAMLAPVAAVIGGNVGMKFMPDAKNPAKGGPNGDGFMKGDGAMATMGTALAGGVAGSALKIKDLGPDASLQEKALAGVKGGLLGTGSGLLANMQHDAIQADGGALKATVFGAGSNMLASMLQKDGPNALQSAIAGGSTAFIADSFHDKLTNKGYGMQADLLADSTQGATLGYTGLGDGKGALMGGALGAAGGFATNKMTESQGKAAGLEALSAGEKEMARSSRAEDMVAGQSTGVSSPAAALAGLGGAAAGAGAGVGVAQEKESGGVAAKLGAMFGGQGADTPAAPDKAVPDKTAGDEGYSL